MAEITRWDSSRTVRALARLTGTIDARQEGLTGNRVQVNVPSGSNANCQVALLTATNLLARFDPAFRDVHIVLPEKIPMRVPYPGADGDVLDDAIVSLSEGIGSPVRVTVGDDGPDWNPDVVLGLGQGPVHTPDAHVEVSSTGWLAHASTEGAVPGFGTDYNPVGAAYAGCLGVAEAFKRVLGSSTNGELPIRLQPISNLTFSTFDYSTDRPHAPNPSLPVTTNVEGFSVIGVGAGGGALVHTLALLPTLKGELAVVDSDDVGATNLNRYIWALLRHVGEAKTDVLRRALGRAHPALSVIHRREPYRVAAKKASLPQRLVASTVHSAQARRQIQYDLPGFILDAAVSDRADYVVAGINLGATDCLYCKHPPGSSGRERELVTLADRVGLPRETILELYTDNGTFMEEQVETIRERAAGDAELVPPAVGQRFSDWFQEQCGTLDLQSDGEPVPVPFLPVAAGVLLAGEVLKHIHFPTAALHGRFTHNMLSIPREAMRRSTAPSPDCRICGDQAFLEHHQAKWG